MKKTDTKKQKESFYLILSAFLFLLMCPNRPKFFVTGFSVRGGSEMRRMTPLRTEDCPPLFRDRPGCRSGFG